MNDSPNLNSDVLFYRDLWRRRFREPRPLTFQNNVLKNTYYPDCGFCCGPQSETEPFPMALLESQISARTANDFYLLDRHTASLDQRGCKSLGPAGCRLPQELRPVACNIFPVVLIQEGLYLYRICPAVTLNPKAELRAMALHVQAWLNALPQAAIRRIAISRTAAELAGKYLDLRLRVQGSSCLPAAPAAEPAGPKDSSGPGGAGAPAILP